MYIYLNEPISNINAARLFLQVPTAFVFSQEIHNTRTPTQLS